MSTLARFASIFATLLGTFFPIVGLGQTQTTGQVSGTIRDEQSAAIVRADIQLENTATGEKRSTASAAAGDYVLALLPPGTYELTVASPGFATGRFQNLQVSTSQVTSVNVVLSVASTSFEVTVSDAAPSVQSDGPQLATELDAKTVSNLPLPTRNFLQLLTLAPGVTAPLINNNAVGRNSPNVSVNGGRVTQNNYRVNGVDASDVNAHVFYDVAVPAPETISEVRIQTSLYDASVEGGGGSVQLSTKSGSNFLHGSVYEFFRNEALNANDANLRAVSDQRPVMRRNVYGTTLGGPLRKNRAFFFVSYQGTREANANEGLYKSVLIAPGLTNDRSATTLINTFGVPSVDPITLKLLNFKLRDGKFLIPTPQAADGRVTGTSLFTYHEEQFNTNLDYLSSSEDALSGKFFFAHARLFDPLAQSNFPGFGSFITVDNHILSLQEVHTFKPSAVNEARFGYNFIGRAEVPQESVEDSSLGMQRSTASQYPGLPFIQMGRDQGGAGIGTPQITTRANTPGLSFANVFWMQVGKHSLRMGGEIVHSEWRVIPNVDSYGAVGFATFEDFLIGNTGDSRFPPGTFGLASLGTGLTHRNFIATDYHLFIQDDWRVASNLTVNLGMRYELDPPPYDSQGRIGGFDPELYRPRMEVDENGFPVGPPAQGIVEAGNALPQYSLPGVVRVGKHILKSIDTNNFGPRVGVAWSPSSSDRLAVRAGYGIFFARPSFFYLALQYFYPPFFLDSETSGQPFSMPFAKAPPDSSFPLVQPGSTIGTCCGWPSIDRNARTPYVQQFNASLQYGLARSTTLQVAYVGTRGVKLFRAVGVNQAPIASLRHPITNVVTGKVINDNTIDNARLRAPMQAVEPWSFNLNRSTAQSTYHSLQTTLNRRFSQGLQFSVAYTLSKSIDNSSIPGGGAKPDGSIDRGFGVDSSSVIGDQLNDHSNRGISDFDRTHYFVCSNVWDLPRRVFAHDSAARFLLSNWQLSGIVTAMSGLPVDVLDPAGGSLYGIPGARPNWAPGASHRTAMQTVPGHYFNPAAFTSATVQPGQAIPSAHDSTAIAPDGGTDFGNVGRNLLRGPPQWNIDLAIGKRFPLSESRSLQFRTEIFNLLNHANRDNPVSDISAGDFGKIVSFSSSPRIVQLSLKFDF